MEDEIDVEGFDEKEGSSSLRNPSLLAKDEDVLTEECKKEDNRKSQIWNEFGVPVCDWSIGDIDQESRLTIESMLHEERQYLKCSNGPITNKRPKKKQSPYLRWTAHERQKFESGFLSYGNKWTQIAKLIPTRTPLQVKNYARYYFPSKIELSDVNSESDNKSIRDTIHSHIPTSLNTGSPTVPIRLGSPSVTHIPLPSKRRHFKKFGFANLSSSRLLKSRSRKDLTPSKKSALLRPMQKMKPTRISPEGSGTQKIRKKTGSSNRGRRTKSQMKTRHDQFDVVKEESMDMIGSSTGGLLEQGGGVVRMRPEESEDEDVDVDVEEDPVGAKHLDRSFIGLAATCDRIYSNLISPSEDPAQSTPPIRVPTDAREDTFSTEPISKTTTDIPGGGVGCVKIHSAMLEVQKTPQEGPPGKELAWNADHTYSMSFKTLQKLGIVMEVPSEPQQEAAVVSSSQIGGHSPQSKDSDSCSSTTERQPSESAKNESLSLKVEPVDSCSQGEIIFVPLDILENYPSLHPVIKLESSDRDDTGAFCRTKSEQSRVVHVDAEGKLSAEEQHETPLSDSVKVEPFDGLADDSITGLYHEEENKGGVSSDESKIFTGNILDPSTSTTFPENNPGSPIAVLENDCQTVRLDHVDGNRSDTDDEMEINKTSGEDVETVEDGEADNSSDDAMHTSSGPQQRLQFNIEKIYKWERLAIPEFFEGRPSKNPDRYLKIRNYIYEHWIQTRPKYLSKSAVRPGLRSCGDVNSIGRIHHSLEVAGVINYNVENPHRAAIDCRANALRQRSTPDNNPVDQLASRRESTRTRKRKDIDSDPVVADKPEDKPAPRKSIRAGPRKSKLAPYDPFKLVECSKFTEEKEAPFHVRMQSDAMVIMDVHSHMSSTEVIGLLGGTFLKDEQTLDVLLAVPCNSISTGMQCEMDPVSQTEAYECILSRGYQVVGWYHSHPAFAANPSIRDIETQSDFQGWFSQGGAPFIGVIVSPCHNYQIAQSKVCCLTISDEWFPELKCRRPYQFDFTVCHSHCNSTDTINTISSLVTKFAVYQYRSEMLYLWSRHYDILFVDKMLRSIKTYMSPGQQEDLITPIRDLITAEFTLRSVPTTEDEDDE